MKLSNILIFCITIIVCGCHNANKSDYSSSEVIKVNPSEAEDFVNLSEIADSIKCIKLQLDSSDVMGKVREIVIREKYIYAMDVSQQCIFVFDKDGRFVSKLNKRGEGPGEYLWMGPVFIDEEEDYIEVVELKGSSSRLMKYSNIDFIFLGETPFPDVRFNSCKKNEGYYYFSTQHLDNIVNKKETNASLIVSDSLGQLVTLFDKKIITNGSSFSPNIESFSRNESGELFVSLMYDNTFYKLKKDSIIPVCNIDFGRYEMDNLIGDESVKEQLKYIADNDKLAFFPVLNMNNDNVFSFSYYFKEEEDRMFRQNDFRQYIKMKDSGKIYHVRKIKNDLTAFPEYLYISSYFGGCAHEVWYKDYLVDIILPDQYFRLIGSNKVLVDSIGEITAEDNPIIIMAKLKAIN